MKPILAFLLAAVCGAIVLSVRSRLAGTRLRRAIEGGAPVVDVRTKQEYDRGHFGGAKHIPFDRIEIRLGELGADTRKPIVVYCLWGTRAAAAKKALRRHGFVNVINAGGLAAVKKFEGKNTRPFSGCR